jgi:DNA-binding YbaB/EbfC family protein
MFNPKQLSQLMKQAQNVQENFKKVQEELASITVEGSSGAGLVKVSMTCKNQVLRVHIDPTLLTEDKSMLEDLVAAAVNDASRKASETANERMSALAPGMPNLGGMGMPSF